MIVGECLIFLTMVAGGVVAALLATLCITLGRASRVAECVFDFLTPLVIGAIFFFSLQISSGGVFRLYALAAFLLGGGLFRAIYRRSLPLLRRIIRRLIVPIQSLEIAISARLEPYRERREKKRAERAKRREERKALRAEARGERKREKAAKALAREKEAASRRKKRPSRGGEREAPPRALIEQIH